MDWEEPMAYISDKTSSTLHLKRLNKWGKGEAIWLERHSARRTAVVALVARSRDSMRNESSRRATPSSEAIVTISAVNTEPRTGYCYRLVYIGRKWATHRKTCQPDKFSSLRLKRHSRAGLSLKDMPAIMPHKWLHPVLFRGSCLLKQLT